uniref:Uncharacterized protein n=1 Tax=Acanthochromis polyacanthus TaxID=80966 RepID=A0A3Q1G324_9TELE
MKEACRICGRELCGNQRRWIFHPTAKLNLQVLLSHALGQELTRDGRGEFACSKCIFMLDRMYRFDTVIARVEALSIERLQRLLQEKHRLRQCIGGLYRKTNSEEGAVTVTGPNEGRGDGMVDISGLTHAKYCALLQDDLVYSLYESWAEDGLDCQHHHHPQCPAGPGSEVTGSQRCAPSTPRRCLGCSHWRVADSDYEAVCKVPRKVARSISCGPSTRYSASIIGGSVTGGGGEGERKTVDDSEEPPSSLTLVPGSQDPSRTSDSDRTLAGRASSSPSVASLETAESLVEEQQSQLNQYECAAGQCVSELQKAQLQVQSLQAKIHESEANNMKLQEKLNEMECELRSLREAAQSQERTIQGLTESISTKDSEPPVGVSESLSLAQLQGELVAVQSSLFSLGLELESSQRSQRQSQRQGDDLLRFKDRLNSDLQEALQHREVTEKHNQRDALLEKLRERIKDRDRALERSIDEKFHCLEEREGQVRTLQLALREKERDLERLRCILSNNEETITSLDGLGRSKELELEQAAEAYRNLQWLKQQAEEKERSTLREKDGIINQLQAALQTRSQETQDLTAALVARVQASPSEVVEELKARLALKEKLFQELLSDRSRQSNEHQAQIHDLLSTLSSKDQYLQLVLERAAKRQTDFGGGNGQGPAS